MKSLIIDKDKSSSQLLSEKLEEFGHRVIEESMKNEALATLKNEKPDLVFFDYDPLPEPQPLILEIKRTAIKAPYLVLMSSDISQSDAIKAGCNNAIDKPINDTDVKELAGDGIRLAQLVDWIADEKEDFPSAGGVISKSAFNQLFRAAIDRACRYGELSYVVIITVENYEDIRLDYGAYASDYAVSKMAYHLAQLRRQSDIIGQTGKNQYALLLQRPLDEKEPVEAASRFAAGLDSLNDIAPPGCELVRISINLIHLPTGALRAEHQVEAKDPA